jgi:competence protein ComEC
VRHLRTAKKGRPAAGFILLGALAAGLFVFGPARRDLARPHRVTVWQFDVGQGDCGLLVMPDGWTMMIDTAGRFGFGSSAGDGPLSRGVIPFLQRQGIARLDLVVLTHGHRDHTGGASALAEVCEVGRWLVAGRAGRDVPIGVDSLLVTPAVAGESLHRWREWEVSVLYPPAGPPDHLHENDRSAVVILRRCGRAVAVWSGDLEVAGEKLMMEAGTAPADVQVWKAGHHGSDTSGSQDLLDTMRPEIVLVSCGVGNGYGHPNHGPYVAGGDTIPVVRTDLQGSVRFQWDSAGRIHWQTVGPKAQSPTLP